MKRIITLLIIVLVTKVAFASETPEYKSTIDYIQKTGRLWGIAELRLNKDNSVTLVDAESGYGFGLMMSLSGNQKTATVKVGESCTLSDGHHAFITYELRKSENGKISFLVTDKFDARSFGDDINIETITITISPY